MTLIVEDGSNVANANSYLSLTDIRAYATSRGITLPVDALLEPMVFKSMDYIESVGSNFQGTPRYTAPDYTAQSLQWPRAAILYESCYPNSIFPFYNPYLYPDYAYDRRVFPPINSKGIKPSPTYGVMIDCVRIANNVIPKALKDLLCQCVLATNVGIDFANYGEEQKFVTKEKVDVLEVTYSEKFGKNGEILISSINKYIKTLTCACGDFPSFVQDIVTE